jgi:hypothetical protein
MDNTYQHITLQFDQAKQPKFEEKKGKNYIEFGKDNNYPNYLLDLYNESPKHSAIVKSKSTYVFGAGFEDKGVANSLGEDWNIILRRCILDDELYRGYYLQVIWNRLGKISDVFHIEFHKVRVSKDLKTFYVKNDWMDFREKPREYPAYNQMNPTGSQILYFKEYNPSSEYYPLPSYFACLNYLEADIQISRHILGNANRQWTASKLVNLNNGDPLNEEKRGEVEKGLLKKFTGSEGQRVVIMFNKSKENSAEIVDLGTTQLTKEDFTNVNNLVQQEIYAGHQIVSPSLMGVKTEGQLGGRNEIRDAYEIFNNTYIQNRQVNFNDIFTKLRNLKGEQGEFKIQPVEPLKFEFTEAIMSQNLTKDEIRKLMGREPLENAIQTQAQTISDNLNSLSPIVAQKVLESMTPDEIRSLAGLVPKDVAVAGQLPSGEVPVQQQANDSIKNLTGRQYQNVMRIVRQFGNGKLTKEQASLMLKNGFGFTDSDVNTFLGIDADPLTDDEVQKFSMNPEDRFIFEFSQFGEDRSLFEIEKSESFMGFAYELSKDEANVLGEITKDKNITTDVLVRVLKIDKPVVESIIKRLADNKIINIVPSKVNIEPSYDVLKPVSELGGKDSNRTELLIRYSYEWRDIVPSGERDTPDHPSRAFCVRMMQLSRTKMWSRSDIETISARLGYSVFDRVGGWWNSPINPNKEQCRHEWQSHIVKKKA